MVRHSRLRLLWFYALRASVFCHGDAAAPFYTSTVLSNAALFQVKFGAADTADAFLNDYHPLCLILTVADDVGVHQIMSLLPGSAAISKGATSTPTTCHIFTDANVSMGMLYSRYELMRAIPRLCACFQPHLVDACPFGRAFMHFAYFGHILAAFEEIELTPTYPPCREVFYVLCMHHNGQLCGTFWANFDLFLFKSPSKKPLVYRNLHAGYLDTREKLT